MEAIGEFAKSIFDMIVAVLGAVLKAIPTILGFVIWVLLAIIILPCVFVAGTVYPKWVEWGENY